MRLLENSLGIAHASFVQRVDDATHVQLLGTHVHEVLPETFSLHVYMEIEPSADGHCVPDVTPVPNELIFGLMVGVRWLQHSPRLSARPRWRPARHGRLRWSCSEIG